MRILNSRGPSVSTGRILRAVALATLVAGAACTNPFETDVDNPNAIVENGLNNPAGATTLVNGLGAVVTRAMTSIYGPYAMATDELTWVGSREFWKNLDDGDVSDPVNEYTDGAFPVVAEARWMTDFTIRNIIEFDDANLLRQRRDLARVQIYGAIAYITIGDMFDDFVLTSDRTVAGPAVGTAGMLVAYDSAITMLDRALTVAQAVSDVELQRQALALRARARHARAARALVLPARTVPANPLINDAAAIADANAALALGGGTPATWRFRLTPTANNLAGINLGFEMNNRGEIRAGNQFVNPDPSRPIVPAPGLAGIAMLDPVSGAPSTTVANAIDACCRPAVGNNVPMTVASARELYLILGEARLAAADTAGLLTNLNLARAVDGLPAYTTNDSARIKLEYERKTHLYLQGRRLMDMYRFGTADPRWLTGNGVRGRCLLPITYRERLANTQAPQPNSQRLCG